MNNDLKELIELKQYVDSLIEQVVLELRLPTTASREISDFTQSIPGSVLGVATNAGLRAYHDGNFIIKKGNEKELPSKKEVEEHRDKSRNSIRHVRRILNTTGNTLGGALAGAIIANDQGLDPTKVAGYTLGGALTGGILGYGLTRGAEKISDIIRTKTKFGKNSSEKLNKKYVDSIIDRKKEIEKIKQKQEAKKNKG